ncbi:hypothetical protein ACTXT7_001317 [Hymenolepis weldensis]
MEARIFSIVRNIFTQMNFSTSTKDLKNHVKNVGIFHHDPLIDENIAIWYTQHCDIYKNIMADLPHVTRITTPLREFNRSDHYQCSSYFQLMDPTDLTNKKMISKLGSGVGDNSSLFNLNISEDEKIRYHEGPTHHPTIIRRKSEVVTPKMLILRWTSSSSRLPFRRRRYQSCNDNCHKEDFYRESSMNGSTRQNPYYKRALTQKRQSYNRHGLRYLMLSLTMCGQFVPAAECRDQDLRTVCEEMLTKQRCVPTKCDQMYAYSVGDLVYPLSHNLNHQWTAAIITKPHGGDIYDFSNSQKSCDPDVVQRHERNDQDIFPHLPPGIDGILLVSRSISRQRGTGNMFSTRAKAGSSTFSITTIRNTVESEANITNDLVSPPTIHVHHFHHHSCLHHPQVLCQNRQPTGSLESSNEDQYAVILNPNSPLRQAQSTLATKQSAFTYTRKPTSTATATIRHPIQTSLPFQRRYFHSPEPLQRSHSSSNHRSISDLCLKTSLSGFDLASLQIDHLFFYS